MWKWNLSFWSQALLTNKDHFWVIFFYRIHFKLSWFLFVSSYHRTSCPLFALRIVIFSCTFERIHHLYKNNILKDYNMGREVNSKHIYIRIQMMWENLYCDFFFVCDSNILSFFFSTAIWQQPCKRVHSLIKFYPYVHLADGFSWHVFQKPI